MSDAIAGLRARLNQLRVHVSEAIAIAHRLSASPEAALDQRAPMLLEYRALLGRSGLNDILERQMSYALTLAAESSLDSEDELKLESLVEDVRVLREIGLTATPETAILYGRAFGNDGDGKRRRGPDGRRGRTA